MAYCSVAPPSENTAHIRTQARLITIAAEEVDSDDSAALPAKALALSRQALCEAARLALPRLAFPKQAQAWQRLRFAARMFDALFRLYRFAHRGGESRVLHRKFRCTRCVTGMRIHSAGSSNMVKLINGFIETTAGMAWKRKMFLTRRRVQNYIRAFVASLGGIENPFATISSETLSKLPRLG